MIFNRSMVIHHLKKKILPISELGKINLDFLKISEELKKEIIKDTRSNPRISEEKYQLPPGQLWWKSRCDYFPWNVITFSFKETPTYYYAKQRAIIMWREFVLEELPIIDSGFRG